MGLKAADLSDEELLAAGLHSSYACCENICCEDKKDGLLCI